MNAAGPNNPLHGITLEMMLTALVNDRGWETMGDQTGVRLFYTKPTIKSSLKLLRTTPWARERVERLYLKLACQDDGKS
jgi:uncharacterized protein (DUF2132 family)